MGKLQWGCFMKKRFDRELYNQFDQKAKNYAKDIFHTNTKFEVKENPKKMGVDLIAYENDIATFYIEVEIKKALDKPFNYDTIHLPGRKFKFTNLDLPTLFMWFSSDGSKFFCCWSKFVLKSPMKEVRNKYLYTDEQFYIIDIKNINDNIEAALRRKWKT